MDIYRCLHKPLDEIFGESSCLFIVTRSMAGNEPNIVLSFTRHAEELGMLQSDFGPSVGGPRFTEKYLFVKGSICPVRGITNSQNLDKSKHVAKSSAVAQS